MVRGYLYAEILIGRISTLFEEAIITAEEQADPDPFMATVTHSDDVVYNAPPRLEYMESGLYNEFLFPDPPYQIAPKGGFSDTPLPVADRTSIDSDATIILDSSADSPIPKDPALRRSPRRHSETRTQDNVTSASQASRPSSTQAASDVISLDTGSDFDMPVGSQVAGSTQWGEPTAKDVELDIILHPTSAKGLHERQILNQRWQAQQRQQQQQFEDQQAEAKKQQDKQDRKQKQLEQHQREERNRYNKQYEDYLNTVVGGSTVREICQRPILTEENQYDINILKMKEAERIIGEEMANVRFHESIIIDEDDPKLIPNGEGIVPTWMSNRSMIIMCFLAKTNQCIHNADLECMKCGNPVCVVHSMRHGCENHGRCGYGTWYSNKQQHIHRMVCMNLPVCRCKAHHCNAVLCPLHYATQCEDDQHTGSSSAHRIHAGILRRCIERITSKIIITEPMGRMLSIDPVQARLYVKAQYAAPFHRIRDELSRRIRSSETPELTRNLDLIDRVIKLSLSEEEVKSKGMIMRATEMQSRPPAPENNDERIQEDVRFLNASQPRNARWEEAKAKMANRSASSSPPAASAPKKLAIDLSVPPPPLPAHALQEQPDEQDMDIEPPSDAASSGVPGAITKTKKRRLRKQQRQQLYTKDQRTQHRVHKQEDEKAQKAIRDEIKFKQMEIRARDRLVAIERARGIRLAKHGLWKRAEGQDLMPDASKVLTPNEVAELQLLINENQGQNNVQALQFEQWQSDFKTKPDKPLIHIGLLPKFWLTRRVLDSDQAFILRSFLALLKEDMNHSISIIVGICRDRVEEGRVDLIEIGMELERFSHVVFTKLQPHLSHETGQEIYNSSLDNIKQAYRKTLCDKVHKLPELLTKLPLILISLLGVTGLTRRFKKEETGTKITKYKIRKAAWDPIHAFFESDDAERTKRRIEKLKDQEWVLENIEDEEKTLKYGPIIAYRLQLCSDRWKPAMARITREYVGMAIEVEAAMRITHPAQTLFYTNNRNARIQYPLEGSEVSSLKTIAFLFRRGHPGPYFSDLDAPMEL